jgi:membrane peptidoglycan carboxypeptidase
VKSFATLFRSTGKHSRWLVWGGLVLALLGAAVAWLVADEVRTSRWQSHYFSSIAREITWTLGKGPSDSIRFPSREGPYDVRMGYSKLPDFTSRLAARGFVVTEQARASTMMKRIADEGLFVPYAEKDQAGLQLIDESGRSLYSARYPQHAYARLADIPPVIVSALTFIKDRTLLDDSQPFRNPAINWGRFTLAAADQVVRSIHDVSTPGGSTLATQIEKFRHSPGGRTGSGAEKLRQMASASLWAYLDGPHTLSAREGILVHYLNTEPLAAQPGGGEIAGLGDGLAAWYGRDFDEVNKLLFSIGRNPQADARTLAREGLALKQALSLLIAQRAPSFYLVQNTASLETLTTSYLRLLASNGIITQRVAEWAIAQPLHVRRAAATGRAKSFVDMKAATWMRSQLMDTLGLANAYDLDRLDLSARATLDGAAEREVSARLAAAQTVKGAQAAGIYGFQMLKPGDDPSKISFSFTLFERGKGENVLRVQTDSVDQPFDVNQGSRLNLGSTAKLRTLILYLQIVTQLHERYAALSDDELAQAKADRLDKLTHWALDYLHDAEDRSLAPMLDAAVEREYSANPAEVFFTGGGEQTFSIFEAEEDARVMTVREAFQHSVNLVFVRLMRDIVRYEMIRQAGPSDRWLSDPQLRKKYLTRFAEDEGIVFLERFRKEYKGFTVPKALAHLVAGIHKTPVRLAAALRSVAPNESREWFDREMRLALKGGRHADIDDEKLAKLYDKYGPDKFDLADRAYLAHVHPLELWLVGYLRSHPEAPDSELRKASRDARVAAYSWLFRTRYRATQDVRIRELIERQAYEPILQAWREVGYPFQSITPSYGSAVGAAGDRPAALAQLMGILVNDGRMVQTNHFESLVFAARTPYETRFAHQADAGRQVIAPEIVKVVRGVLRDVVTGGTARRVAAGLPLGNGRTLEVSGKTGTGDQRFNVYASGARLIESRKVNRTATFVYTIGDRFYGTITAFVHEPYAERYSYTSAMAVQLLKSLGPALAPVLDRRP